MHRSSFALAAAAAFLSASPASAAQDPVAAGEAVYQTLCANCHGRAGTGNGPIAEVLTVKPADLTQLAKQNGGKFPFDEVYQVIDGRAMPPGHGTSQMPIWGNYFTEKGQFIGSMLGDEFAQDYVRGRILSLVYYLQSIQKD